MKTYILHVTQSNGGVSRYLQTLIKYMDDSKYSHILVCSKEYVDEEKIYKDLVDKIEFIDISREISILKDLKAFLQIRKIIKIYKPDMIYLHSSKAGAIGRLAALGLKIPVIYNPHGWAFDMKVSKLKKSLYILIEKTLEKLCSKIIAISDAEKISALKYGIGSKGNLKVIYNGIDIYEYKYENSQENDFKRLLNIPEDSIIIGMVGRISQQKAPDIFVRSARMIKDNIPNAYFIIVGDGDEKSEINSLIESLNLQDAFLITGWVDNPYKYIEIFDIAMLLSRWEGFGLAIAEYMICEKPIIATDVGAIPNLIVNNENGILVEVDNIYEVVSAAERILKDKEFAQQMVNKSKDKVYKEFDVRRVASEHEALIKELNLI